MAYSGPPQVTDKYITPGAMEFLLHCHFQGFKPHPRLDSRATTKTKEKFLIMGVIQPVRLDGNTILEVPIEEMKADHACFGTTARGKAWVEKLCHTTCPTVSQKTEASVSQ